MPIARVHCAAMAILLALAAACDDPDPDVEFNMDGDDTEFSGREVTLAEGDEFAMPTRNGAVKLGLTRDHVYIELSEAVRERVDSALETDLEQSDSRIARSIGGAVRRGVRNALEFDFEYPIDDIEDVDYRDGALVFRFRDGSDPLRNIDVDDEPITRAFSEEDARAFVSAFRRVKAGESVRADTGAAGAGGAPDEKVTTDTAGGASF